MSPTIHFIRHAQGYHNLTTSNHSMHDPHLTTFGEQQCRRLAETFPYTQNVDMIVASPLKRTIQTALLSFPNYKNLPIIALPEVQETSDLPCDTGSKKEEIEAEFNSKEVDLSLVKEGWNSKQGRWSPLPSAINERCRIARKWLSEQQAEHIVVVTHGGLLHYLTQDWEDSRRFPGTGWANTEYRSYTFDRNNASDFVLIETEESKARRSGIQKPLSEAETRNLKHVAKKEREEQNHRNAKPLQRSHEGKNEPLRMLAKLSANHTERDWIGLGF